MEEQVSPWFDSGLDLKKAHIEYTVTNFGHPLKGSFVNQIGRVSWVVSQAGELIRIEHAPFQVADTAAFAGCECEGCRWMYQHD